MKNTTWLFAFLCFSAILAPRSSAQSYIRLQDASGLNTDAYQDMLQTSAAKLCAVFDTTGFAGQFHVYDFGFYLHSEHTTGGYPDPFAQKIVQVQALSPYYLLFGKQTDATGVYSRFWVNLKLPATGKFGCIDLLSSTLRTEIGKKVEYATATAYAQRDNLFVEYAGAELAGMEALLKLVLGFVSCCDLGSRGSPNACVPFIGPASLTDVTFSGANYIEIKQEGDVNFGLPFPKPHYLSTRLETEQSPVACVSGFNINATAVFKGNDIYQTIKVKGKGEMQVSGLMITLDFPEQAATQDPVTKEITASLSADLPYKAVFLNNFKITWEMNAKKPGETEGDWELVGTSINDWYLTLRQPIAENSAKGYLYFQTLLDISCKYGKGSSNLELINGVWQYFAGKQVRRADGKMLTYYGQWADGDLATSTEELLKKKTGVSDGDGMCTGWTKFFLDVLKIQGFKENNNYIYVVPNESNGFFIKDWNRYAGQGTSGNSLYPFKNIAGTPNYNSNNSYNWQYQEVSFVKGLSAQGNNNNPVSDFGSHVFARVNGELYDPSYGVKYGYTVPIPDPNNPGYFLESVPTLKDNYISAFYKTDVNNQSIYSIQMNTANATNTIILLDVQYPTH